MEYKKNYLKILIFLMLFIVPGFSATVSGTVFTDTSNDNIQNGGETGISGVRVRLFRDLDDSGYIWFPIGEYMVAEIDTDANGDYSFSGISDGNYTVFVIDNDLDLPLGSRLNVLSTNPRDIAIVSDIDATANFAFLDPSTPPGYTHDYGDAPATYPGVGSSTQGSNNDARHLIVPGFHLGKFIDADGDGTHHNLLDSPDALGDDNNNTDDEDGVQILDPLIPGQTARIRVFMRKGTVPDGNIRLQGFFDLDGNNAWFNEGDEVLINKTGGFVEGYNDLTISIPSSAVVGQSFARFKYFDTRAGGGTCCWGEAGSGEVEDYEIYIGPLGDAYTISGTAYHDDDNSGTQNGTEAGMANVSVKLYRDMNQDGVMDDSDVVNEVVTDSNGNYSFTVPPNLKNSSGEYFVLIDQTDADITAGYSPSGLNPIGATMNNANVVDVDFPFSVPAPTEGNVIGHIYNDVNGNGQQDVGEADLSNVDVNVTDALGNSQVVTTNANGDYNATGVAEGDASVDIDDSTLPAGSVQTEGTDPTTVTVTAGQDNTEENNGYQLQGNVIGHIYNDLNGNGQQDVGEADLSNVDVNVTDALGNSQVVTTNANGDYNATGVSEGDASVDIDDSTLPAGSVQTEGTDPTTVTVTAGQDNTEENNGYQQFILVQGNVVGHIYEDSNGNGQQDVGEADLSNVDVNVTDALGNSQVVTTNANGDYNATGVSEGDASVDIDESTLPAGSVQTEGTDPTTVTVTAGQDNTEENNGFIAPGTLRGHIYHDENGNGTQDSGEINVPNITVNVIDANGTVHTVETNATGDYIVTGLSHGNAVADIDDNDPDIPAGAVQTEGDDPTTILISAGNNNAQDINGYQLQGNVVGHIYNDVNGNGIQESNEANLSNVTVTVTDEFGSSQSVVTNANGDYNASGVAEGDATVDIDESTLSVGAVQTEGTNPTAVTVLPAQDNVEENNGFQIQGNVIGHIYHDENGNGTQDAGEDDIEDINVTITDALGNIQIVITDANGDFNATGLAEGNATVAIDTTEFPEGFVQTEGSNPTTNVLIIGGQNNREENNGFNVAPIAEDDTASTLIDTSVSIPVLNNDHDYDGERVILSAVSPTANGGSVTWDTNGTVIYTPALGYVGTDTFEYTIRDNFGSEDNATVTIIITDPDDPLSNAVTAVADSASTEVDTSVDIRVLENDYDLEGDDFNISDFNTTTANGGSITLNDNGTSSDPSDDYLTYTPASGFEGDDVFVYEITDENGAVDRAIVVVRVSSEAVDPDADPVPNAAADAGMTDQDLAITIDVLGNDTHPEGDTLTVIATTDPANGSVVIESNGSITYTPNTGFVGYDTFMYTIEDENGDIATAAVTVGVVAAPDLMIGDATVNEGDDLLFDVNISHPYGADINLTLVTTDITAMDGDDYDGTPITVTIPAGETGVQALIPTVEDTTYEVDENMTIAVQSIDAGSVGEHSDTGTGSILDDDPVPSVLIGDVSETEGDVLSFEVNLSNPSYEDINITFTTSDGSATTTDNDYTATTVIALIPAGSTDVTVDVPTISDGYVESDETMTLAVIAVSSGILDDTTDIGTGTIENDDVGPTANDDTTTGVTGEDTSINVIGNDSDGTSNLDANSVRIIDPDTGDEVIELLVTGEGTWSVEGGVITFVPEDGFTGDPTPIEYTVQDIWGNEDVASLTVDYPPVARDDNATGELNEIVNLDILANDDNTSKPLDPLSVVITDASGTMIGDGKTVVVSGEGTWIVEDNGTITFEPEFDFAGDTTPIYYTVSEENSVGPIDTSNPAKVTVQYPELVDDVWNTSDDPGTPQTVPVLDNDAPGIDPATVMIIDPDTNVTTDILVVEGEGTWSVDPSTGEITFEPEAEFVFDPTPVTYIAEYNGEETNIASLIVNYPLLARDDEKLDNDYGTVVTLADLYNDNGDINSSSVELHLPDGFMDIHPDAQMSDDSKSLIVPGQGEWIVNDDGTIMFVPEVGFEDDPTPIEYSVADNSGARSNFATLVVTYCDSPQASDSGDALSSLGILLMGLLTGLVGLYFVRKEEESRGY